MKLFKIFASREVIEQRKETCKECEFNTKNLYGAKVARCSICSCFITAKCVLSGSECPANIWVE